MIVLTAILALLCYALYRVARDTNACIQCSAPVARGEAECNRCEATR